MSKHALTVVAAIVVAAAVMTVQADERPQPAGFDQAPTPSGEIVATAKD